MRRVSVVGSGPGAGKTSFARALASRAGLPFIELDALHWQQGGWVMPERDAFRARVSEATAGEAWVADGNYSSSRDIVWGRADTVVYLDLPLGICLWRVLRRAVPRIIRRDTLWAGNRETVRNTFFSRDSLLLFTLRTHARRRQALPADLARPERAHLRVHRFGSTAAAERWLRSIPAVP